MAIANADGSIVLTTKVDTSGVKKGMDEATKFAQLNTNEQRRLAQSLSAVYRKQGLTQSEAQKKAWKGLKEGTVTAEEYKKAIEGITLQTEEATKSTKKYGEQAKKSGGTAKNAFASIGSSLKKMATMALAAFSIQKIIQFNSEASNLATTTEASVQRLIDIYGEASEVVGEFIDLNAQALGMSRAAASSYASVYGNLFSVWADQATNAKLTNNYLNMTAVVASKTGRTVEDVQERIRSGLLGNTEAIEDLGIFVNVKTIEMTDAFQKMASGKSWEQLDAYTQQQIRTLAILEQATQKYGMEVAQTTALTKSQFKAAWQDFQATWGEVINQVLVPVLMVLTDILVVSTEVMSSLFGMASATISQGDAVDDVIDKQKELTKSVLETAEATQKSLAGFDDLQILNEKSSTDEINAPQIDLPIFNIEKSEKEASAFEEILRNMVDNVSGYFSKLKEIIASVWNSEPVQTFWDTAQSISGLGLYGVETLINTFKEKLQLVWDTVEDDFNTIITNLSDLWTNFWSDAKITIDTYGQDVIDGANGVFSSIYTDVVLFYCDLISKEWADLTTILKDEWELSGEELLDNMGQFFVNITDLLQNVYDNVISPIIAPIFETISKLWDENISVMIEKLAHFITTLVNGALEIYNEFIHPIISWITEELKPIFDDIGNYISSILYTVGSTISDVLGGIFDALGGLIDFITGVFTGDWEKAWEGIKTFFGGIWDTIWGIIKGIINSIINGINALWEGLYTALREVINGVGGVVEGIGDLIGKDWGWEIPENPPKIPALAQGAVLPPNKPFLAMVGDQKHGTNIEAPLQTIVDAFNMALAQNGGIGNGNTEVVLEIDGREFGRAVVEQGNRENRRIGTRLVIA